MALNIKNPRAEELVREVSKETGQSITHEVIVALEERLQRLRGRKKAPNLKELILDISHRCGGLPDLDPRSPEEILAYGPRGTFEQNGH